MNTNDSLPKDGQDAVSEDTGAVSSRRIALIRGVALAAGAGLALAAITKPSRAQAQTAGDITLLNALLSAEWAAIAAYMAGAGYLAAPSATDPMMSSAPTVLAVAGHFMSQHQDHATQLSAMITAGGGTPVAQSSVAFTAPTGWTASVANVLKLAANAEKAASIGYTETLKTMSVASGSQLVAAIGGVETQHFVVLYALLQGVAAAGTNIATMTAAVAPTDFTSTVGTDVGLQSVADFTYA